MDIINHTLTGIATATVIASASDKKLHEKAVIIFLGAAGSIFPDIDAVSKWSKFDDTIGALLGMAEKGRDIYISDHWYSHHNFMHSIFAGLFFSLLLAMTLYAYNRYILKDKGFKTFYDNHKFYCLTFFLGFTAHLLGDLPTPGGPWSGIKLFWPLSSPIGGSGYIWWWNNYDIFLIALFCCIVNIISIIASHKIKKKTLLFLPIIVYAISLTLVLYQVNNRGYSFAYDGYSKKSGECEAKSQEIQKTILGDNLHGVMIKVDKTVRIPF